MTNGIRREFANNRPTWIWRICLTAFLGMVVSVVTWGFTEVAAIPKVYPTKAEIQRANDIQDRDIIRYQEKNDRDHQIITQRIDEGFKETQRIILDLHK